MLVATIALAVALAGVGGFFALYDTTSSTRVSGGGTKVVAVALVDAPVGFDVTPDVVTVDPGTRLVLEVVNKAGEKTKVELDAKGKPIAEDKKDEKKKEDKKKAK